MDEPIDRLVAAIDRLAAATLAAALVRSDFPAQKVHDTSKYVLDSVIHEDRDMKANSRLFKQL